MILGGFVAVGDEEAAFAAEGALGEDMGPPHGEVRASEKMRVLPGAGDSGVTSAAEGFAAPSASGPSSMMGV